MAKSSEKKSKSRSTRRRVQSALARPRPRRRSDDTDDDEVRERIRKARYPPGVIDSWLSRVKPADSDVSTSCATPHKEGEVLCTVYLEYKEHPETHKGFDDGGVYTLYLRLATPPTPPELFPSESESPTSSSSSSSDYATLESFPSYRDAYVHTTATPVLQRQRQRPDATPALSTDTDAPATGTITLATYDGWNTCMDAPRWTTLDPTSNSNSKLVFWESREKVAEVLGFVAGEREQAFIRQVAAMSLR